MSFNPEVRTQTNEGSYFNSGSTNTGVPASLNQFGIIDNRIIDSYLQQEAIRFDAAHWYESIGWQKWIAYYGQGPDAFTDWRRLGYPQLIPGPDSVLGSGELPRRFFYPVTEQSLNGKQ